MEKITAYKLSDGTIVEDEGTARDKQAHIKMVQEIKELADGTMLSTLDKQAIESFFTAYIPEISQIVFNHINLR